MSLSKSYGIAAICFCVLSVILKQSDLFVIACMFACTCDIIERINKNDRS